MVRACVDVAGEVVPAVKEKLGEEPAVVDTVKEKEGAASEEVVDVIVVVVSNKLVVTLKVGIKRVATAVVAEADRLEVAVVLEKLGYDEDKEGAVFKVN